jgi:GNAT superfamily N-acetyltransferase
VDVRLIDPRDDRSFADWFAVVDAAQRELWPGEPGRQAVELRAQALADNGVERMDLLVATDAAGTVVGSAHADVPLRDNLHLVTCELWVHPDHRRRGAGTALLAALEARAAADGRMTVMVDQDEPAHLGTLSPGFAVTHGYKCAQRDLRRDLAVPVDPALLAELDADCAAHAHGYRVVTWRDRCPDRYVEDRALLGRRMSTDIPLGDLAYEEEYWDAARVRGREDIAAASDRTLLAAAALHEDTDRLVAFTEIQLPRGAPTKAYQWDTLVLAEHRGHRLGTLVKLANLRQLAAGSPATTMVSTYNAEDNGPMIAVNERLGAVVTGTLMEWQKHL